MPTRLTLWLPPALWMATILWLSTGGFSAEETGAWLLPVLRWLAPWASETQLALAHGVIRHTAHAVEYAILAWLWVRALTRGAAFRVPPAAALALAVAVAWACVDELHQSTIGSRTGSLRDVLLDTAGAGAAALARLVGSRRRPAR